MNLIKLYRGKDDSVMALYEDGHSYYVTETGAGWDKEQIALCKNVTLDYAIAYTDDIAQHCPLCYKASKPTAVEFADYVSDNNLTYTLPPSGDGSCEIDGHDISWSTHGRDYEAMESINPDRIYTVVDGDGDDPENPYGMYVLPGFHYVNRQFYIVLDQPFDNDGKEFIW